MVNLVIVDGSNYIYRAYYSHKDFKNSKGEPTGAIFGFIKSMQLISKNNTCADIIVVFDTKGNTFRNTVDENYKGNRSKVPEDLKFQFPIIREACDICGYSHIEDTIHKSEEKYEADDIIASLVKKYLHVYDNITIYTGDKDLYQLIGVYPYEGIEHKVDVHDCNLKRIITQEDIRNKFGVDSSKVSEYLMLVGDHADNISGCYGIGKVLASDLLNKYGTINEIYKNLNNLPKNVQKKLIKATEVLPKMHELVALKFDYPCTDLIEPVYNKINYDEFCKKWELNSLIKVKCEF